MTTRRERCYGGVTPVGSSGPDAVFRLNMLARARVWLHLDKDHNFILYVSAVIK